jgi:16S rRNA (cytosine967-C5)-methyltransferase
MAISPARAAAFDILLQVERDDAYASELLHSPSRAKLSSADHGLATELVMGVLRWRSRLDSAIAQHSSISLAKLDLEVLIALRIAAYQLLFLERVPRRAAINESVDLVKRARKGSAAGFANAVLRKIVPTEQSSDQNQNVALEFAHPEWLVDRWGKEFGDEVAEEICNYDQQIPQTTIRIFDPDAPADLRAEGIELAPGEFLVSARHVKSGDITQTAVFKQGRIAIQDEGSQLVGLLAGKGNRILDCCAAPGGKTRILANRNPQGTIVAVELHEHRSRLLRKLVLASNVEILTKDITQLPVGDQFDCVLADVPCSGTGTLAHNPEIKWRLTAEDLIDLQKRQLAILQAAMNQVALGGRLVYSTCSLEREENSDVVEILLKQNLQFRLLPCRSELELLRQDGELNDVDIDTLTNGPYLRTIPGVQHCDGFFAAVFSRTG